MESVGGAVLFPGYRESLAKMREALRLLLLERAVHWREFVLVSGAVSNFYIDCRVVTTLPHGMWLIGFLMLHELSDLPDLKGVGGLAIGADPISASIAFASASSNRPVPMFLVRKEPKDHGLGKRIEGAFPKESAAQVAIVDDVMTRGGSVLQAIQSVEKETKATVARVVVIVDREEGGSEMLRARGYDVRSIFTRRDFLS